MFDDNMELLPFTFVSRLACMLFNERVCKCAQSIQVYNSVYCRVVMGASQVKQPLPGASARILCVMAPVMGDGHRYRNRYMHSNAQH